MIRRDGPGGQLRQAPNMAKSTRHPVAKRGNTVHNGFNQASLDCLKGHAHDYACARGYSSMTDLDENTGTTLSLSLPGDEETTIDRVR